MTDDKKLVREEPGGRRRRDRHSDAPQDAEGDTRGRRRRKGRAQASSFRNDVMDMQRGGMYVGIEAAAATMDIVSHLMRNAVDRAFAKDYREPGDLLRGVTRDAGDVLHDAVDEVKDVPDRLNNSFYEAVPRRPTRDRGERHRRAQQARNGGDADD